MMQLEFCSVMKPLNIKIMIYSKLFKLCVDQFLIVLCYIICKSYNWAQPENTGLKIDSWQYPPTPPPHTHTRIHPGLSLYNVDLKEVAILIQGGGGGRGILNVPCYLGFTYWWALSLKMEI